MSSSIYIKLLGLYNKGVDIGVNKSYPPSHEI
jgi:hypothetical protein